MELDLFFPSLKIGVEIQGPTHTGSIDAILRDYHKKELFEKELGIRIIYIYLTDYKNFQHSLKKCKTLLLKKKKNKWLSIC